MRKISNTEENNQYYKMVNEYIDDYITNHKINPANLRKYFKNSSKLETFLKRYKLDDVEGIKRVVEDVIDDWHHIQSDGVMKFEKFTLMNEDLGNIKIKSSDMGYEKVLADLYHTSVGHVDKDDETEHKYNVKDFGKEINVIIYSKEDVEDFKKSLLPILFKSANSSSVDLHKVNVGLKSGKEIRTAISFNVGDIVDDNKLQHYIDTTLDEKKLLEILYSFINDYAILKTGNHYVYKQEYKGYHIWVLNPKSTISKNV